MKINIPYFNNKQRKHILFLLLIIVIFQFVIFVVKRRNNVSIGTYEINEVTQLQIDSLKQLSLKKYELQPFNPNFITDYKGFKLGMSVEEINKLVAYRATGKYVNSVVEFQKVTGVSAALLDKISPYFKFPEWAQNRKELNYQNFNRDLPTKTLDINKATRDELVAIKGIGDYYANAVVSEREKLGAFVSIDQIDFIKGIRPEAIKILKQNCIVKSVTGIQKVNVNTATKEELMKIPYVNSTVARQILVYRSKQDGPLKMDDIEKINNFPLDKLKIIKLYLAF